MIANIKTLATPPKPIYESNTAAEVNEQLLHQYQQILNRDELLGMAANETKGSLSGVFVPKVSQAYLDSDKKIFLVGKEAKEWCGSLVGVAQRATLSDYLDNNMARHSKQAIKRPKRITFLRFYQALHQKLGPSVVQFPDAVLWANLFCISLNERSPLAADNSKRIAELSLALLEAQIEVLKPDVIMFATGPNYDKHIKMLCQDFKQSEILKERELWRFESRNFVAYRTTHPAYSKGHSSRMDAIEYMRKDLKRLTDLPVAFLK